MNYPLPSRSPTRSRTSRRVFAPTHGGGRRSKNAVRRSRSPSRSSRQRAVSSPTYDAQGNPTWRPRIVAAFCEEALWLLERTEPQAATLRALGVTRATVGEIEASFSREDAQGLVCPMARQLVGRLGYFEPDSAQGGAFSSTPLAI